MARGSFIMLESPAGPPAGSTLEIPSRVESRLAGVLTAVGGNEVGVRGSTATEVGERRAGGVGAEGACSGVEGVAGIGGIGFDGA